MKIWFKAILLFVLIQMKLGELRLLSSYFGIISKLMLQPIYSHMLPELEGPVRTLDPLDVDRLED